MVYNRRRGRKPPTNLAKMGKANAKAKQYVKPANVASVVSLSKQIQSMKKKIRRETEMKKYFPTDITGLVVAQVDVNNSGTQGSFLDVCNIPAGVNDGERVGITARLKGMHYRMQLFAAAAVTFPTKIVIDIFKTMDFSGSLANIRDVIYEVDSISGVVDAQSTMNKEFVGKGKQFQLISRRNVYFKADDFSGAHQQLKDIKFFIKQNQELSYAGTSTSVPQNVRYIMFLRATTGNRNGTTASTLPTIPVLAVNTGFTVRWRRTDYYTDS